MRGASYFVVILGLLCHKVTISVYMFRILRNITAFPYGAGVGFLGSEFVGSLYQITKDFKVGTSINVKYRFFLANEFCFAELKFCVVIILGHTRICA